MFIRTLQRILLYNKPGRSLLNASQQLTPQILRHYPAPPKRFYKRTGVICSGDGAYEITLDNNKLKTPKGEVFKVESELMALAIATEWNAQQDEIQQNTMHLTSLCMTSQDNPQHIVKYDAVQKIVNFLESDTILFFSAEEELNSLQKKEWSPVISWFCEKFKVEIGPTQTIANIEVPLETKQVLERHLLCYNLTSIHGFLFAVDTLKSLILTLACVERQLSVEQAVILYLLEEEYQTGFWGKVEWSHDVNRLDIQARFAAAVIFIQVNSMSDETKSKLVSVIK